MRLRLLNYLVCPIEKTELTIKIWDEKKNDISQFREKIVELNLSEELFEREIINGVLINEKAKYYYPIVNGVPRMFTYDCGVFSDFKKKFEKRIETELKGYSTPRLNSPEGEESVIKSFSTEWLEYDWDPKKYWRIDYETMYNAMEFLLDLKNRNLKNKVMLEVGIGIGGIADSIQKKKECELVGMDLSYAVDGAYKNFKNNLFFHIVQASAFHIPFKENTFDYVYSHGVLHHSSDPKRLFFNVSKLPKKGGDLYVWLYSDTSENRNLLRRGIWFLEKLFRPIIWPLPQPFQNIALFPFSLLYIFHQNFLESKRDKSMVKYSFREAYHAARDRFTPRYAFRYSEDELSSWYKEAGYENLMISSERKAPDYVTNDFLHATSIIGKKK